MGCHHLPLGKDQQQILELGASLLSTAKQRDDFRRSVRNKLSDGNTTVTNLRCVAA